MADKNDITRKKLQLLFDEETRKLCLFLFLFSQNISIQSKNNAFVFCFFLLIKENRN